MTITLKQFVGATVTPKDDAILYNYLEPESGIINGCSLTYLDSNRISISSGRGLICGRMFEIQGETINVSLSPSQNLGRLKIKVDTTNVSSPISFVSETATSTLPALVQEDINDTGTIYELPLATYSVGTTTISNLVDVRHILDHSLISGIELHITSPSGTNLSISDGTTTKTAVSTGNNTITVPNYGTWTVTGELSGSTVTSTVTVDTVKIYSVSLSFFTASVVTTYPSGATCTCTKGDVTITAPDTSGSYTFTVTSTGTWTITATSGTDTATTTVSITTQGQSTTAVLSFVKIYGVYWDGTSSQALNRTDDAENFTDPIPYYGGASSYSSPFDNIQPWAGMTVINDGTAGKLVAIPKFYYKLTKTGSSISLKITTSPNQPGFHTSPAHADRGDGHGERDVVYIGAYSCSSNWTSVTGVKPICKISIAQARTGIHNLGNEYFNSDISLYWSLRFLYLVEYANWNSQSKVGFGAGDDVSPSGSGENAPSVTGYTDSLPYHTGTNLATRSTPGYGTKYRNIEGLWENVLNWVDGIYTTNDSKIKIIKNPNNFAVSGAGDVVATNVTEVETDTISSYNISAVSGYDWFMYPASTVTDETGTTYIGDYGTIDVAGQYSDTLYYMTVGGSYYGTSDTGMFHFGLSASSGNANWYYGARIMKLPN